MKFEQLIPRKTNRAFFVGMTGSGKSFLAKQLLRTRASVLIYDAKDEIKWEGYERFTKLERLVDARPLRAIYAPNIKELDDPRYWNWFYKYGYLRGNVTIYTDESYAVTDGQELPFYMKAGITRGRSKGVEMWSATQRPIDVPQFLMSESENKYVFYLEMPQDKEKIRKMTGISETLIESLSMDNHEFIYRNRNITSGKLKLNV